ncbi:MAG TPA: hypothetical protein VKT33_13270 [Candidatus Angelobacter sp.]|nr:hypothetical protein [Candidatus Angelobacter sp.]
MKKLFALVCALALCGSLAVAQATGGSTAPDTTTSAKGKKHHHHKGGKKHKKGGADANTGSTTPK